MIHAKITPAAALTRSQAQCLAAIRRILHETGCPPSLGDLAYRLHVSRQRVWELVKQLDRAGAITRTPREARSIRLAGGMIANISTDDLIRQREAIERALTERGEAVGGSSV